MSPEDYLGSRSLPPRREGTTGGRENSAGKRRVAGSRRHPLYSTEARRPPERARASDAMAILEVLHYPDPRLRNRARPVEHVDERVRQLVDDMLETMYAAPGIGLAAVQVNVPLRVITIDCSEPRNEPVCLINPTIEAEEGELEAEEGCLSVPGVYESVTRSRWIRVRALDRDGEPFELEAEDLLAVCVQHEMDHLEGKLFVDYLSRLKQARIRRRTKKLQRQA